jgi:hypothetical protein
MVKNAGKKIFAQMPNIWNLEVRKNGQLSFQVWFLLAIILTLVTSGKLFPNQISLGIIRF